MNFEMLNLKLVQNGDAFDVIINAENDFLEEFGFDFSGENIRNKYDNIQTYIKDKYPNKNLGLGKIMLSGVLVGTFALGGAVTGYSAPLETFSSTVTTQAAIPFSATHSVKSGDTLWIIANQYGVDIDSLRASNNLTSDVLNIGQNLTIPGTYLDENNQTDETFTYSVKSGDTLWIIANKNNISTDEIRELNHLTSDALSVGQELIIPINNVLTNESDTENEVPISDETFSYTVKSGDTLWLIANRNGTTVNKINEINKLSSENLIIGQQILLPVHTEQTDSSGQTPVDQTFKYTVKAGDTLWLIANRNNTTVSMIEKLNNLTSENLTLNQQLLLPVPPTDTNVILPTDINESIETGKPVVTTEEPTPAIVVSPDQTKYIVQTGDTLWSVSSKFGTTIDTLKDVNNLSSDYLSVGQTLIIIEDVVDTSVLDSDILQRIKYFPIADGYSYYFTNDYASAREWTPTGSVERTHEGNDIMSKNGTPIVAVADGTVSRYGWNNTGGNRLMIKMDGTNNSVYYAHMSQYAPNISLGSKVTAGQVIGYVGSTGYGPQGTSGKFEPHLHIGIYTSTDNSTSTNPFDFMRNVESVKTSV